MEENQQNYSLPDNAYTELKPGESYKPILPAGSKPKEVTPYSVTMGLIMAILFSAAAAYLGLKVGQVFEAAIPIAIIAVGVGNIFGKKNTLGQNTIIQSIGASSGVIVAGAIFTLPALYILGLEAQFYQIFLSSLFGGLLGILLIIPFRKYFVKDMHGKLPFPEATATTEVLVSGEKKGNQAKVLAVSGLVGGLYDFIASSVGLWTETISTRVLTWGEMIADKFKVVFKVNTGAAVLGLGYIVGLKYAAFICAGSFTVWFVLIPLISYFAPGMTLPVGEGILQTVGNMTPEELFFNYGRPLGIGGIAMAGIIGIIKSSKIIRQALGLAVKELKGKKNVETRERTERDLPMKTILSVLIAVLVAVLFFFHFAAAGLYHLVPLYDGGGQCHRHRGVQPGVGHDADDAHPHLARARERGVERNERHDGGHDNRRRGVHGALHGRRLHYRPQDRLLDRGDARPAGEVEISRCGRIGGYGGRCHDAA